MPKIRFSNRERDITFADLTRLQQWVKSEPLAPEGDWYKDFGSFKICGKGEYLRLGLAHLRLAGCCTEVIFASSARNCAALAVSFSPAYSSARSSRAVFSQLA